MWKFVTWALVFVALGSTEGLGVNSIGSGGSKPDDIQQRVAETLDDIAQWLGESSVAESWRRYLLIDALRQNLSDGSSTFDQDLLLEAIARFRSDVPGIDKNHFRQAERLLTQLAHHRGLSEFAIIAKQLALQAKISPFRSADDDQLRKAQRRLADSLERLDSYLDLGSEEVKTGWRQYIEWDALVEQTKVDEPDPRVLARIIQTKLQQGYLGLERPAFVEVRRATAHLRLVALGRSVSDSVAKAYVAEIRNLQHIFSSMSSSPSVVEVTRIYRSLDRLESLGFDPRLVAAIRQQFEHSNLRIVASETVISKRFTKAVHQAQPVSERILGTDFSGTATTTGTATAKLLPSPSGARFQILFDGQTISDSLGVRHPIRLGAKSYTKAKAHMPVLLTGDGFTSSFPTAECSTRTQILWIQPMRNGIGSRLIEKIAWKKAFQQKPLAEKLASERAELRISKMMKRQADEALGELNRRFRNQFRPKLVQRGVYPRGLHLWTTSSNLLISALQGSYGRFGAPGDSPSMPNHKVQIQLHESMPTNTAFGLIGGLNLDQDMARELAEKLTDEVPPDLTEKGSWKIQFDFDNPVILSFRDNQIKVGITGRRFESERGNLEEPMEISATYQIIPSGDHFVLRRSPEIDVVFPRRRDPSLGIKDIGKKSLMQGIFASVFGEEVSTDQIELPENLKELRNLTLSYISAQDGWLSLGWN